MISSIATFIAWSHGLAGVFYLALVARVVPEKNRGLRGNALLFTAVCTAVWGFAIMASALLRSSALLAVGSLADVLVYGGWYAFLFAAIGGLKSADRTSNTGALLLPVAAAVVLWGLVAHALLFLRLDIMGAPARMVLFDSLAAAAFGLVLVEHVLRTVADESKWAVIPACLGLGAAFAFDIYTFADGVLFNAVDPDVWSVRGLVRVLALFLVAISLARTHGGKSRIVLSREAIFRSTALLVTGVYLLFMAAAGYYVRYFSGEWGRAFQVALLFAALLLLIVLAFSRSMRAKLRVLVSKHFFRYRYDYREEWLRFTQALSNVGEHGATGQPVIRGLANMVESPGGALWLRDITSGTFMPAAQWNMPRGEPEEASGSFATFLATSGWVINLEELRSAPERYASLAVPEWLSRIENAWLVVPLAVGAELMGFVVLATARTPIDVNWEVNDLLKTAGRQAASFLGHVQTSEALLEARKFEAFNRLSAFVVHDLKNIVAQLSLMLRNAERHRDNPEFQKDMLMTVEHSVERMKQLMLQLRDGTTPLDVRHRVELADLAARVARAKAGQKPPVEVEVVDRVAVRGHEDRLERVIGHLTQNALDATAATGRVWIKIAQEGRDAVLEVGDTGHGMTPDFVRERLFKPFQTTKPTGMGIGAYESHQYVNELGGRVIVDSSPNVGTRVRLFLPLIESTAVEPQQRNVA